MDPSLKGENPEGLQSPTKFEMIVDMKTAKAVDLHRFVAEYTDDVRVFRPPAAEPVLSGKAAFAAHYAANRFTLPELHAEVLNRIVSGNKVVDHERITGLEERPVEAIAVYEVIDGRIRTVWFFYPA